MRALRFYEYGGPEVLRLEDDVPVPEAGEGQVLIKVAGAGVNPVDWKIREGLMKNFAPVTFPATVGREFVANVDATGLRPASMDAADAGGVALTSMTAWQALFDNGGLKPGMKVLIQSASGGVGTFAVQIAKWGGAHVIGTCSAANAHLVQELGADEIIDYKSEDYAELLSDIDLVIETSPQNMQKSLGILKPGGTLVSLVGPPPKEEGKNSKGMSMQPKREQLSQISDLIEDLKIRPVIDTVVPFSRAIDLQNEVQKGHTVGKVVVRLSE
jgi:NADPH:quinone reductase-like Zn-dependent oxidoreductase